MRRRSFLIRMAVAFGSSVSTWAIAKVKTRSQDFYELSLALTGLPKLDKKLNTEILKYLDKKYGKTKVNQTVAKRHQLQDYILHPGYKAILQDCLAAWYNVSPQPAATATAYLKSALWAALGRPPPGRPWGKETWQNKGAIS